MSNKTKILLLGGEGFIGRNISDLLARDYDCFSVGRSKPIFPGSRAQFIAADPYKETISGRYDVVIQLSDKSLQLDASSSVGLPDIEKAEKRILKNLDLIMPKQVIFFSTANVYLSPDSKYARAKLLIEDIYRKYCQKKHIGLSILRLFNIFGPYQLPYAKGTKKYKRGSLVAKIIYSYFAKEPIEINDLNAQRDFIYSLDMAKCIQVIIERKLFGIDDLATNKMITIGELLSKINLFLPQDIKFTDKNINEETCPAADSRVIKLIRPSELEKSLEKTVNFYKNNWPLIKAIQNAK